MDVLDFARWVAAFGVDPSPMLREWHGVNRQIDEAPSDEIIEIIHPPVDWSRLRRLVEAVTWFDDRRRRDLVAVYKTFIRAHLRNERAKRGT